MSLDELAAHLIPEREEKDMETMSTLNGFDKLESLSEKINKESNQVNEIIKGFEDRLIKLNLGTEVWLGYQPVETPLSTWIGEYGNTHYVHLGFSNYDREWRLVVAWFWDAKDDEGESIYEGPSNLQPLLESSRAYRLEAVTQFPRLLQKLQIAATNLLDRIGAAKEALGISDAEDRGALPDLSRQLLGGRDDSEETER